MNITRSQLKAQYDRAVKLGWLPFFQEAADTITKGYFDAADLMGIGSRETNLDPKWLRQLGDGGHAGGLMQADIRSFPDFISSGKWKDARQSILFGARVLMLKWQDYEAHIGMTLSVKGKSYVSKQAEGETVQHLVIASYNCGRWSQYCYAHGIDLDKYTTGHDYGADVMERASVLRTFMPNSAVADPPDDSTSAVDNAEQPTDTSATEPVVQPPPIENAQTDAVPTPSIWDRMTDWKGHVDTLSGFKDSLLPASSTPISGASRFVVLQTKLMGWGTLIAGFWRGHWYEVLAGVLLVGLAIWYLEKRKTANGPSQAPTAVASTTTVVT